MEKAVFVYPGDPPRAAFIMTGAEFVEQYRGGGPGFIQVNDEPPEAVEKVRCDLCYAEIAESQRCMLIGSYLYCDTCTKKKERYLVKPLEN